MLTVTTNIRDGIDNPHLRLKLILETHSLLNENVSSIVDFITDDQPQPNIKARSLPTTISPNMSEFKYENKFHFIVLHMYTASVYDPICWVLRFS